MSRMYNFVRCRQLEGTYPGDPQTGCWIITSMRVLKGWGAPTENEWPYDGSTANWPPHEPKNIDALARPGRILAYQRVRSIEDCKRLLSKDRPIVASFVIDESWDYPTGGRISVPQSGADTTGSH